MQIELLKPHTHAGLHYAINDRLTLEDAQALWLISLGVARAAPSTPVEKNHKTDKSQPRHEEKAP